MCFDRGFTYVKVVGGSGGLRRYRVLVRFPSGKKPIRPNKAGWGILEFKELAVPAIRMGTAMSDKAIEKRVRENLIFIQGEKLGSFYRVVRLGGKPFELRPRWNEYKGIALEDFPGWTQRMAVLENEAYVLGGLHRQGAEHPRRYAKAVGKTRDQDWIKAAEFVRQQVWADYKTLAAL